MIMYGYYIEFYGVKCKCIIRSRLDVNLCSSGLVPSIFLHDAEHFTGLHINHKGPYIKDVRSGMGGGGQPKSRHSKGGCVDLLLQLQPKFGQGGRGSKNPKNFADVLYVWPLNKSIKTSSIYLSQKWSQFKLPTATIRKTFCKNHPLRPSDISQSMDDKRRDPISLIPLARPTNNVRFVWRKWMTG